MLLIVIIYQYAVNTVTNHYEYRLAISKNFYDKKYEYVKSQLTYILLYTFYGGIVSSMVGIGGGMVITPIMFQWNANPKVVTSTSNMIVLINSFAASMFYFLAVCVFIKLGST
jgi:uncharacterized membrane protein YfcA